MAKAPTQAPGGEIGRRISARDMGYSKSRILEMIMGDKGSDHFLFRVVGVASGLKPYRNKQEGDRQGEVMFGLLGQFEATNADGEVKVGSVCYLPGYVNDMIVAALSMEDTAAVRIAFDVYARFDESAATSYVFTARDLLNAEPQGVAEVKAELASLPMPPKTLALPKE